MTKKPKMLNWMASCGFRIRAALILMLLLVSLLGAEGVGLIRPANAAISLLSSHQIASRPGLKVRFLGLMSDRVDEISVEKISQFIQAYLQVIQLLEQFPGVLHRLDTTGNSVPQPNIEQAALEIIEAAGLTRQEYLQLLNLANADPDFSDRIAMQLEDV